ncbi:hypothetical protein ACNQS2_11320 [Corynebacterium diphtheriae]
MRSDYVGEAGYNAHGGYNDDKTGRYADQFGLGVALDRKTLGLGQHPGQDPDDQP